MRRPPGGSREFNKEHILCGLWKLHCILPTGVRMCCLALLVLAVRHMACLLAPFNLTFCARYAFISNFLRMLLMPYTTRMTAAVKKKFEPDLSCDLNYLYTVALRKVPPLWNYRACVRAYGTPFVSAHRPHTRVQAAFVNLITTRA